METLDTSKTLIEDTVMFKLNQEQNPCAETLDGASGFSTSTSTQLVADNSVINNIEVENQVFDAGEFPDIVQGQILVGGERVGDEENCWNFGLTEIDTLVNEAVSDDSQMKECTLEPDSGGIIAAALYSDEMASGYELVQEVCATDRGVEEVDAEKVAVQEAIEEVDAEKVAVQEAIEEVDAEKVVVQEAIEEVDAEMVAVQEAIEEGNALQQNVVDSGNNVEVSTAGISLYVDVFGPVVQGDDSYLVKHGVFQSSLNEGNAALLPDDEKKGSVAEVQDCSIYKNGEGNDVEGKDIAYHGYRFNVGDLSWVQINTQLWWPGVIGEHSVLASDDAKTEHDHFQVRLFGSGNVLWGKTSQLKPFHGYFEQMSRQSNSASFHCAVEKAVLEIGRRAKLEMTCPCYLEESRTIGVAECGGKMSKKKACKLDGSLVLQFEPENLLARIKCFARDVAVPGTIECKVIQNRISAFYRSIGHHQLPIHQLKPTTDAKSADQNAPTSGVISSKQALKSGNRSSNNDLKDGTYEALCTVIPSGMKMPSPIISTKSTENRVNIGEHVDCGTDGKAEKSYESRERRKSKYLSFPYVDPSRATKNLTNTEKNEMTGSIDDTSKRSSRAIKSHDKKSTKSCRKHIGHDVSAPNAINASTAEMLSKLRFTALDCLYPNESKNSDILQSYFSRFRIFSFRDFTHELETEDTVHFDDEIGLPRNLSEVEIQTEKQVEKEASRERWSTKAATAAPGISKTAGVGSTGKEGNINSTSKSRKKENSTPLGLSNKPTDGFPGNITTSGSIVIDFQTIDPHSSGSQTVLMKRKRKAKKTPGLPEIKVMVGLAADLKGRDKGAQLEGFCVAGAGTTNNSKSEPKRKKGATSANHSVTKGADLPHENRSTGKVGAGLKEVEVMGPYSVQNIPELSKEGMKEPASLHLDAELAPRAPDVSNYTEPTSIMKGTQQMDMLSHSGNPELKRKREQKTTNVTSAIVDLNGNIIKSRLQETQLPEMKCTPPEGKPQRKRKKKTDAGLLDINLGCSEAQTYGEALGTALLLKFAPEAPIPTKECLISTFCKFGPLKDSETKVLNDFGTAQVVFVNFSDARTAFCSLEKNSPLGPALVNYRLHVLFAASGVPELDGSLNMHQVWPDDKVKSPPKPRNIKKPKNPGKPSSIGAPQHKGKEAPDLQFVRQNLQMMTSMLENAGDNISAEMRAKLEVEIKSLLNKVSSMVDSSSTS